MISTATQELSILTSSFSERALVNCSNVTVLNSVISYRNRKTKFPMTDIGGNMHNFNISRVKDEYGEFSMLYTENYPHT